MLLKLTFEVSLSHYSLQQLDSFSLIKQALDRKLGEGLTCIVSDRVASMLVLSSFFPETTLVYFHLMKTGKIL